MFVPPLLACCSFVLTSCAVQNICVVTVFTFLFLFYCPCLFTSCFVSQHVLRSCDSLPAIKFHICFSPCLNQHLSFRPSLPRRYSLYYGFYPPRRLCSSRHVLIPSLLLCSFPPAFFLQFGFFFSSLFVFYLWSFLYVAQHIFDLSFSELFSCHRLGARSKTLFFMFSWHLTSTPPAKIYTVWVCASL